MNHEIGTAIPANHPALEGHFPSTPVVPGALVLEQVLGAWSTWQESSALPQIVSAKFIFPVPPAKTFVIRLREWGPGHVRFECLVGGKVAVTGELARAPTWTQETPMSHGQ